MAVLTCGHRGQDVRCFVVKARRSGNGGATIRYQNVGVMIVMAED